MDVNENFVSIAIRGILNMYKGLKCTHLDMIHDTTTTCRTMIFSFVPHDGKRLTKKIVKEWWCQHG
jgi:hypothetical protein